MLLSLVLHTYSMRYLLPSVVLLGSAPTYLLAWALWRVLSALLPARLYQRVDDRLYCVYQNMVLFFFENYTGVQPVVTMIMYLKGNLFFTQDLSIKRPKKETFCFNALAHLHVKSVLDQILLYGDLPKNKENVIYLANHQSTVDWIIADMLAARQNALGHVRYVLKDRLKWIPLYGFYFAQHGGIYVKRSAKFNEKEMRNMLQSYVNAGTPMYLVIFPEGTRYNRTQTKVLSASQAFAAQRGLPVLKHVLTPRIKATHVAFDSMKSHLDAIYDVTVVYEGNEKGSGKYSNTPSMTEFLCKQCPKLHIHFDRIDKNEVPEEQEHMKKWLHERFEIKDKLLIEFYDSPDPERRNKFPGKSVHSRLSVKKTLPSVLMLGSLTAVMLMTESGRKLYVGTWLYGTLLGCLWFVIKT